jgi:very-short-patch-repair endonuclease
MDELSPRFQRRAVFKRDKARALRDQSTPAERKMWSMLRGKKLSGFRFRRQQTLGPYIVDFCCSAAKLIVELDGSQHHLEPNAAYDEARTKWLEECGYKVLRFDNAEFLKNTSGALDRIWEAIQERAPMNMTRQQPE